MSKIPLGVVQPLPNKTATEIELLRHEYEQAYRKAQYEAMRNQAALGQKIHVPPFDPSLWQNQIMKAYQAGIMGVQVQSKEAKMSESDLQAKRAKEEFDRRLEKMKSFSWVFGGYALVALGLLGGVGLAVFAALQHPHGRIALAALAGLSALYFAARFGYVWFWKRRLELELAAKLMQS